MAFHPAGILCLWLCVVIGIQFAGFFVCCCLALFFVCTTSLKLFLKKWLNLLKRNIFLFVSLWLVLAYQTPGDLWHDLPLAPTDQGIFLAWQQSQRLALILAALVWLHLLFDQHLLCSALFTLLAPFSRTPLPVERFIVRLALVLENFQHPPQFSLAAWREWLNHVPPQTQRIIHLPCVAWQKKDLCLILPALLWFGMLYYC